ncbi:hypothetical protein BSL78_21587 [Apostichopus japonicus]|uniref:PHD finger protein rhinoceros n=1 Tax=Stichopus japonicus TaxID=307972 RepID=A0A2G8K0P2_STIJA|nr:hypothetical protein BSL78_21587 [Apostichopus japonicus]
MLPIVSCKAYACSSNISSIIKDLQAKIKVFRKDLISAMKLPDSYQLQQEEYWVIQDQWKQEWEKGVQVPVDDTSINDPQFFEVLMQDSGTFKIPDKLIKCYSGSEEQMKQAEERQRQIEATCQYDLDEVDIQWLHIINREREDMGDTPIDELTMEKIIEQCEIQCQKNIEHAIQTEEGLGIEYDEDICCAVCRAPDSEDGNEMVFCDKCDICVHQACYGVIKIPEGSWMCRCCALGLQPECMLCGKKGGAMKSTRSGTKWAHVNCALWIPEVSIGDVERMEPITKISQIPPSRWALICNLCRERTGACIQCSVKTCKTAYHVTCGVEQSLEMEQVLDENKDVKFRSFCLKHTNGRRSPSFDGTVRPTPRKKSEEEKANARAVRIQRVTEEFQKYVKLKEVATSLNFKDDIEIADLVFEYWKLKRKSGFNKPLLHFPLEDDKDKNSEEYNLHARMKMFVHLRQDLERVRNLCYMVQRREKLSRQMLRLREGLFKKQCEFFNGNLTRITDEEVDWAARAGEISARVPFPMSEDVILNKWLSIPSDGPKLMFHDDDDDETSEDDSDLEMEAKKERDKKKREKVAARKKKEAEVAARLKEKLAQVKGPVSSNTRGVKHRRVSSMDGKLIYEDEIRSRKGGTPTSHLSDSSSKSSPGGNDGGDEGESREVTPERKPNHVSDTLDRESSETDSVEKNNSEPSKGNLNITKKVKGKTPMKSHKSEKLKERPVSQNKLDQNDRKTFHRKEKPNSVQNHKLDHKPAKRKSIEKKEKDSKHSINNKDRKNFKDAKRKGNTFERKKKSAGADSIHTKNHVIKEDPKNHFLGQGLEVKEEWTYWQTSEQRKVQSEKEVRHDEDKNAAEFLLQEVLGDRTLAPLTPFEEGHARSRFEDFIERHAEDQNAADFLANEIFDVKISSQDMKNKLTPLTDGIENNLKEQEFLAAERLLSGLDGKLPDWQEHGDLFGSKSDNLEDILGKEPFQLGPEDEKLVDKVLAQDIFQSQTRVPLKTNDESKKKRKSRQTGLDSIRETSKAKFKEQHKPEKKKSPDLAPKDHQRKKSDSKKAKEGKSNELSREHWSNHHSEDRLDSISGKSAEKRHNDMTSKVAKKQQHKKDNMASVDNRSLAGKNKKVLDDTRSSRDVGSGLKENGEMRQRSSEHRHSLSQAESNKTQKKQSNQPNRTAPGMEQDSSEKELVASKKESRHTSRDDRTSDKGQKERTKSHKSKKINGERAQKEDERKLLSSKEKRDLGSSKTREGKEKPSRKEENKPPVLSKGNDNPLKKQIDKKEKLPQSLKDSDKGRLMQRKFIESQTRRTPVLPGETKVMTIGTNQSLSRDHRESMKLLRAKNLPRNRERFQLVCIMEKTQLKFKVHMIVM